MGEDISLTLTVIGMTRGLGDNKGRLDSVPSVATFISSDSDFDGVSTVFLLLS